MAARDVGVGFGAKTVLSGIDLGFTPSTITALIGPTGCGKSTFLRSLNRMNDKVRGYWRTGTIELDGVEISGRDMDPLVLRRRVGMVFQRPNPFPMSIRDNVVAGVQGPPHGAAQRAHRRRRALPARGRACGRRWPTASATRPFRLSGGQQQLLCLARALAVEPDVLLLDEPTSSLDPVTTEMVEEPAAPAGRAPHHRDRHPQPRPGPSRGADHRLPLQRAPGRGRRHRSRSSRPRTSPRPSAT